MTMSTISDSPAYDGRCADFTSFEVSQDVAQVRSAAAMSAAPPDADVQSRAALLAAAGAHAAQVATEAAAAAMDGAGASLSSGTGGGCIPQVLHLRGPRPFEAYYDLVGKQWKMFLPEGSLVVDGVEAMLSEPTLSDGNTYYLHVKKATQTPSGASVKARREAEITDSGDKGDDDDLCVKVVEIDESRENKGIKTQYLVGAQVIWLGSTSSGGYLEPEYDSEGNISGVTNPYVMVGRTYVKVGGTPSDGMNVVRVDHGSSTVTATIEQGDPTSASTDSSTTIGLYRIKDGKIVEDFRNLLVVPMYDPPAM
jgi:hypothetical protein